MLEDRRRQRPVITLDDNVLVALDDLVPIALDEGAYPPLDVVLTTRDDGVLSALDDVSRIVLDDDALGTRALLGAERPKA